MAKRAQGVVQSDASVQAFENIIAHAYKRIHDTFDASTPTSKARRRKIAKQIEAIANDAKIDMAAWTNVNVAAFYEQGAKEALDEMKKYTPIFDNNVDFVGIHKEAIQAIAEDMRGSIAQAMAGITATGEKLLGNAAREAIMTQVASGKILGSNRREITKQIKRELRKEGLTALVDKGGRKWDLNRYSTMLARTKLTQAHNSGVRTRMAEMGGDLAMVSKHFGSCQLCAPYEGEILSVNGRTRGYETLDRAMGNGLFHPNCRHVVTPWHPTFLTESTVWDADNQKYVPFKTLKDKKIAPKKITKTRFESEVKKGWVHGNVPKLNKMESVMVGKNGIEFENATRKRVHGLYRPASKSLIVKKSAMKRKDGQQTFFHELGHAIDFTYNKKTHKKRMFRGTEIKVAEYNEISKTDAFRKLPKDELKYIIRRRVQRNVEEHGGKIALEDIGKHMATKESIKVKQKNGTIMGIGLGNKHVKYLHGYDEIFADGYGQFRTEEKKFKKQAPTVAKFYKKIMKKYE